MKLELYYFESCPFCVRVLNFLDGIDHSIEYKDTMKNRTFYDELRKRNSGKRQVPCLFVDNKPMLESIDIIEFLKKSFS